MNNSTLLQQFQTYMKFGNYSDVTLKIYGQCADAYLYWLADEQPSAANARDFIVSIDCSQSQKIRFVAALKMFLRMLNISDTIDIRIRRKQEPLPVWLSPGEIKSLLNVITNQKHYTICMLLFVCGLRASEVCVLKRSDLMADGHLRIYQPKTNNYKMFLLDESVKIKLVDYLEHSDPSEWMFPGWSDKAYSKSSVAAIIDNAARCANISKKITPHVLRHSFAVNMLNNGASLIDIQNALGHASITSTTKYLRCTGGTNNSLKI